MNSPHLPQNQVVLTKMLNSQKLKAVVTYLFDLNSSKQEKIRKSNKSSFKKQRKIKNDHALKYEGTNDHYRIEILLIYSLHSLNFEIY